MKQAQFSLALAIVTLLPFTARAEGDANSLSIDAAVQEAKDHSPTIQRFRAAAEESHWKKNESLGTGFLPKVSSSAGHYFNEKYEDLNVTFAGQQILFPSIYPTTALSFDVAVPLFDGFANVNHLNAASLSEEASEKEQSHAEFQIEQDVRLAFYKALGAEELETVALENVKTLEEHERIAQARQKGGSGTQYDVLRVDVQLSEARTDALNATDNVTISRRKLTELLGIPSDARKLAGSLPIPHADLVQGIELTEVPSRREDIQALDLRATAADVEGTARAKWMIPTVSLGADYTMYNNVDSSISDTSEFRSAYNFGIFLQWSLFDGGVSIAKSKEAGFQKIQTEKAAEEAKDQVPYDFELWKRKYLTNAARFEAKKLDVKRSEESVRLALAEQKAGTRSSTEVLDAELDLFRSKAGVVDALLSSAEAQIQLENTIGKKI